MSPLWHAPVLLEQDETQFVLPYEHWLGRDEAEGDRLGRVLAEKLYKIRFTGQLLSFHEGEASLTGIKPWYGLTAVMVSGGHRMKLVNSIPVYHYSPNSPELICQAVYEWADNFFVVLLPRAIGKTWNEAMAHVASDEMKAFVGQTGARFHHMLTSTRYGSHTIYCDTISKLPVGLLSGPLFDARDNA